MRDENKQDNTTSSTTPILSGEVVTPKNAELSEEEKELQKILIPFKKYPKLKRWAELFLDKSNSKTYGNRTESAVQAGYNCQTRADFSNIGSQNYRRLHGLASILAEDKGMTVEKMISIAAHRAITSENPEWFKLFAAITHVHDPKAPSITINNLQQNNFNGEVSEAEKENFDAKFKEFLEKS